MKESLKRLKIIFAAIFGGFIIVSAIAILLKKVLNIADTITLSNKLTMVIMIVMMMSILGAYFIYDRFAKKSKDIDDENENERLSLFSKAVIVKLSMFSFVGVLTAMMLIVLYQDTYLYMLGIIGVFFLINFPNEIKYKRDFVKRKNLF